MEMRVVVVLMIRREKRFGRISSPTRKSFCFTQRGALELTIQQLSQTDVCSLGACTRRSAVVSGCFGDSAEQGCGTIRLENTEVTKQHI